MAEEKELATEQALPVEGTECRNRPDGRLSAISRGLG
jgi:hypothetical protein